MSKHFFKNLRIKNFRGIKSLEINGLARVNLFVGKNNCGKTTVLEAAFLLAGINNPGLIINMQNNRGVTLTEGSDIRDFFHNRDHKEGAVLSCVQMKGERNLKILPLYGNLQAGQTRGGSPLVSGNGGVKHMALSMGASATGQSLIGLGYQFTVAGSGTDKGEEPYKAGTHLTKIGELGFTSFSDDDYEESVRASYLGKEGYDHDAVDRMLNRKRKDVLMDTLKSIDPKITDIKTGSGGVVSVDIGLEDSFIPINLLGDGVVRILNIHAGIDGFPKGILAIDEIENGLHVTALEQAWKVILNQSEKSNAQIFLTTHSMDAIESLRNALGEELFPDVVACYRLVKCPTDEVRAYRYSADQLPMALDSGTDIRL
ncbi:MAG: AAA family ATPase [Gammaproteobacteria bacterium]|nr:AAA family ATPase [Gammaproteobacteria bacterium]